MPRRYDYSHEDAVSTKDYIWSIYRNVERGDGEMSYVDMWGPGGLLLMDGLSHQFDLATPKGTSPYDNAVVDPVYRWLCENTSGPWQWHESEGNNNRSVTTHVYLEKNEDISAFISAWPGLFRYDAKATISNAEWRADQARDEAANVMPGDLPASRLKHAVLNVDTETAGWLDAMSGRSDFETVVVRAIELEMADLVAEPPSKWGPRLPDGLWQQGVLAGTRALGEWLRARAPEGLFRAVSALDIGDATLADALHGEVRLSPATPRAPKP